MRFLLCLLVVLAACGRDTRSALDIVMERGELIIGTEAEFPPFESKNAAGEFVGFDMDLARELANDLGVKLRIDDMQFSSLPTALDNGTIDLIISGMTATPERAKTRSFTKPYFITELCLLVHADSGITEAKQLHGKKIIVKRGTTGDIHVTKTYKDSEITRLDKESACALEVVNGRAAAFVYDRDSIIRHNKEHPKATRALLKPLTREPYAMAARLGDTKFVDRLNRFLDDIKKDGRDKALREKHLSGAPDEPR